MKTLLAAGIALVVAATGVSPRPASASTATGSSTTDDPSAQTIVPQCPPGGTPLPLIRTDVLPDGGTLDWYQGTGSPRVPVPPSSFDPLSATASELEAYGFPPRPSEAPDLAEWTSEMRAWKPTPDYGLCQMSEPLGSAAQVSPIDDTSSWAHTGSSWSGYVAKQTTTTYIATQGDFYQAAYHTTYCDKPMLWGSWTGLGGYYSDTGGIIQTGTAVSISGSSPTYYAWTEVYPLLPKTWSQVVVHPGDHIHTYVVYQRSTGLTTMYVADDTTGTQKSEIETQPLQYYDGRTAEAIDERNGDSPLLNFGSVGWFNLKVQKTSGTWYNLGTQSPEAQEIYSNFTKQILSLPDGMSSSTAFTDRWYSCAYST